MPASRRQFLRLGASAMAATLLGTCSMRAPVPAPSALPADAPPDRTESHPPRRYQEAPMLAERVARGELPPVDERLPTRPYVLEVNESLGRYGGAWRCAYLRYGLTMDSPLIHVDHGLTHLDRDLTVRPYVAESWEVDETGHTITWHLRPGMRWSNGDPVTSEDFAFYWLAGKDYPSIGHEGLEEKVLITLEDDYTFTFGLDSDKPSLFTLPIEYIHFGTGLPLVPSRFARQYHPDYAAGGRQALEALAASAGYANWGHMYRERVWQVGSLAYRPNKPTLLPWGTVTAPHAETVLFVRNPYYWQVDVEGRQLPYLDHVLCRQFTEEEPLTMMVQNRELDCQFAYLAPQGEDAYRDAGYNVHHLPSGDHIVLQLNPTTSNAPLAAFVSQREVRLALSLALNRTQMSVLYGGLATPRQYSPMDGSPLYDEELAQQHLQHDPARAAALLDGAGYGRRDSDGYRLSPDGERLRVFLQSPYSPESTGGRVVTQVCADLEALGLECTYWQRDADAIHANRMANSLDAAVMPLGGTLLPSASIYNGFFGQRNIWRGLGRRPDDHYVTALDTLYEQIALEPDMDRRNALFRDYLAIWKRELPLIGLLGDLTQLAITREGFMNVQDGLVCDALTNYEAFQHPQQFSWHTPEPHALTEAERKAVEALTWPTPSPGAP